MASLVSLTCADHFLPELFLPALSTVCFFGLGLAIIVFRIAYKLQAETTADPGVHISGKNVVNR
jgi:hypothetical protein